MATVNYKIEGDLLPINIQMTKGFFQILAKTIVDPDGDRCLIYDCYSVSLNTIHPNATDIEYYMNKIRRIVELYEQGFSANEILKRMVQEHINQHGRIIDNDLMMIVSALNRIIEAIEGKCDDKKLILSALDIVLNNYIGDSYVTIYNQTPYGVQPQLVPMKNMMNA